MTGEEIRCPMSVAEMEAFSSLIGHVYDAALDPERWPVVLERASTRRSPSTT